MLTVRGNFDLQLKIKYNFNMKTCSVCLESKPLEDFGALTSSPDGRSAKCRACKREYDNAYYRNKEGRKEQIAKAREVTRHNNRKYVWEYLLAHPCVDCGETDPLVLQFDHVQGNKLYNVSYLILGRTLKMKAEIEKCVVRCANCHSRKTARDFGWYASFV